MTLFFRQIILPFAVFLVFAFLPTIIDQFQLNINELKADAIAIEQYIRKTEEKTEKFRNDTVLINKLIKDEADLEDIKYANKNQFIIFIYKNDSLLYWSDNKVIPYQSLILSDKIKNIVRLKNGYYLFKKLPEYKEYRIVTLIPVKFLYDLNNRYLENRFAVKAVKNAEVTLRSGKDDDIYFPVKGKNDKTLFYLTPSKDKIPSSPSLLMILLNILAFLFFFLFVNRLSLFIKYKWNSVLSFFFLLLSISGWVIWTHYGHFVLKGAELFDPHYYATTTYGASLGELGIRVILFFWLMIYFFKEINFRLPADKTGKFLISISLMLLVYFMGDLINNVIRSLIIDSKIPFAVNNFLSLNLFSLAGLFCVDLLVIAFFVFAYKVISIVNRDIRPSLIQILLLISGSLIIYLLIELVREFSLADPALTIWVTLFLIILFLFIKRNISLTGFGTVTFWLIFFAFFSALLVYHFNSIKEKEHQRLMAEKLSRERDPVAEFLLNEVYERIKDDPFIHNYFQVPHISDKELSDRIRTLYFTGYLNRYDVNVHTFNSDGVPYRQAIQALPSLRKQIFSQAIQVGNHEIYYHTDQSGTYRYWMNIKITENNRNSGYLVAELLPKVYRQNSVYPELLLEEKLRSQKVEDEYSYAIYARRILVNQEGNYPYEYHLDSAFLAQAPSGSLERNNYVHWVYQEGEKIIIVSTQQEDNLAFLSFFSYLFSLLLIIVLVFLIIVYMRRYIRGDIDFRMISLRNRIQLAMIAIIFVSFFAIGLYTVQYFRNQYNTYHKERLLRKMKAVISSIDYLITEHTETESISDIGEMKNKLMLNIPALSDIHTMDINIYNMQGDLVSTSQSDIFEKGLLSEKMDPVAWYMLKDQEKMQYIQDERIAKLPYLSAYAPLRTETGEWVGFLNLPYFAKEKNLQQEISSFLVALINVYVLLLLAAGFFALLISDSITKPLEVIREKLRRVKLGQPNTSIEWDSKDEIGVLVEEYNRMLFELQESAELLARSERESAWREMAKQVAHEIKNPLTPMKLSIQQLQRALEEDRADVKHLSGKVARNLIEQINNLSRIASEFSSFAKMPKAENEEFNIVEVVRSVVELHEDENVSFKLNIPDHPVYVYADKNQMTRVFNNLIRNSIQAISDERKGKINTTIKEENSKVVVSIEDNGEGIAEEEVKKVFEPNFTTKSSGTGLGLAMSRNIIESAGGSIWFESEEGKGTVFYVRLDVK